MNQGIIDTVSTGLNNIGWVTLIQIFFIRLLLGNIFISNITQIMFN